MATCSQLLDSFQIKEGRLFHPIEGISMFLNTLGVQLKESRIGVPNLLDVAHILEKSRLSLAMNCQK
ncbi:hypothetical protein SLA2020_454730 [Shorea laevis]